jgi:hypothetical protein
MAQLEHWANNISVPSSKLRVSELVSIMDTIGIFRLPHVFPKLIPDNTLDIPTLPTLSFNFTSHSFVHFIIMSFIVLFYTLLDWHRCLNQMIGCTDRGCMVLLGSLSLVR